MSTELAVLLHIARLSARMTRLQDQSLGAHGISFREYQVLHTLQNGPETGMRRIDLAEALEMSASGITRLLNPMEKTGLLGKEAGLRDARVSLVRLTDAGREMLENANATVSQRSAELIKALPKKQRVAFKAMAEKGF
jgi:DNA-binding MarR family transcriptional regulator